MQNTLSQYVEDFYGDGSGPNRGMPRNMLARIKAQMEAELHGQRGGGEYGTSAPANSLLDNLPRLYGNQPYSGPAPDNTMVNNRTGASYNFTPQPAPYGGMALDYSSPIDVMGRKGFRLKNDPTVVAFEDGSRAQLGVDQAATQAAQDRNLKAAQIQIEMEGRKLANDKARQEIAYGKTPTAPAGYRYKTGGDMEAIPGGPADIKTQEQQRRLAEGGKDVDIALGTLRDAYNRLEEGGGITSTKAGPLSNIGASASSSAIGQGVGRMLGTANQSARNDIAMARPALLAALMRATGMSAKQMDSNAELKLWLATATDPTLDVEANRRALDNIERKYLRRDQPTEQAAQPAQVAPNNAKGWTLHVDGNGNRAYVGPNGEIEEVR